MTDATGVPRELEAALESAFDDPSRLELAADAQLARLRDGLALIGTTRDWSILATPSLASSWGAPSRRGGPRHAGRRSLAPPRRAGERGASRREGPGPSASAPTSASQGGRAHGRARSATRSSPTPSRRSSPPSTWTAASTPRGLRPPPYEGSSPRHPAGALGRLQVALQEISRPGAFPVPDVLCIIFFSFTRGS